MRRTIHYVFKIGDRRAAINFYTRLLGMQVCVRARVQPTLLAGVTARGVLRRVQGHMQRVSGVRAHAYTSGADRTRVDGARL